MALRLLALLLLLPTAAAQEGRVVVLGFDGADARTVQRLIDAGQLPHLAQLAEEGTFAPLRSVHPAESAAGWAAINTGVNPLESGVPGFLRRSASGLPRVEPAHITSGAARVEAPAGRDGAPLAAGVGLAAAALALLAVRRRAGAVKLLAPLTLGAGAAAAAWSLAPTPPHVPSAVPAVYASRVSAPGFWDVAAAAGKRALVLDAALAFGGEGTPGARVLSGLGLPDATGQMNGHWSIYTTEETELQRPPQGTPTRSGTGRVCRVDERGGQVTTRLYGPRDFTLVQAVVDELAELEPRPAPGDRELEERITAMQGTLSEQPKVAVDMTFERRGAALAITVDGVTHEAAAGAWTGWFRPVFRLSDGTELRALTRARVLSAGDVLSVYIDPLHIDPEAPPAWQPISSPASFSADLARWSGGPYETLGWACLTNQMKDRSLPVEVFLEDVEFTMRWRERLTTTCLARDDWELLFSVFSTVDRVQHVMYRHADVGHPRHDATEAAREVTYFGRPTALRDVLDATYVEMDRIVGEVLATLAPEDQLLLCADHGFTSFRHGFHVNNWLAREGYLVARPPRGGGPRSNLMTDVDWTRTRAYSLGLGMIYLNLRGREPQGIVPKRQAQALLEELRAKLLEVTDDSDGAPRRVVLDAVIMRDLYPGGEVPWGTLEWPCADLMLGLAEYYRVSWDTVSGDVRYVRDPRTGQASLAPNFSPNNSPWSGDHASTSPSVVTGAFFSRRAVTVPADGVSVLHIAPTVLDALGVAAPDTMDLAPLR